VPDSQKRDAFARGSFAALGRKRNTMNVPPELKPYYEFTFINCFAICSYCGAEQDFSSSAKQYSDDWYFDMASAIQHAGWVIPTPQQAACHICADVLDLRHDPVAPSS
jgi:hypothetical protein